MDHSGFFIGSFSSLLRLEIKIVLHNIIHIVFSEGSQSKVFISYLGICENFASYEVREVNRNIVAL